MRKYIIVGLIFAVSSCGGSGGSEQEPDNAAPAALTTSAVNEDEPVTVDDTEALMACLADGNALESENAQLQSEIAQLETENSGLRQQITELQSGVQPVATEQTPAPTVDMDAGNNLVLSCTEAARRIREVVQVGMTQAEVTAILGSPPAVFGNTWYYNNGATAWPLVSFDSRTFLVDSKIGTDVQCDAF